MFPEVFPKGISTDIIGFLSLVLAFIGGVSFLFYELNKKDNRKEMEAQKEQLNKKFENQLKEFESRLNDELVKRKEVLRDETFITRSRANMGVGVSLLYLYIYHQSDTPALGKLQERALETSIEYCHIALEQFESIKNKHEERDRVIELSCLNNICVALVLKAVRYKNHRGFNDDKKKARDYARRIAVDDKVEYKATRALVLWVFAENEEEDRNRAHDLIDQIKTPAIEDQLKDIWRFVFGTRKLPCDAMECGQRQ